MAHGIAKHHDNRAAQTKILTDAYRSVLGLSLAFAMLFFLTAGWDADLTQIGEMAAAYLIIGATLPLRNLFILGLFVSSWKLGVYAEASILARFLLLIPVSIKPIFRRQYCLLASRQAFQQASRLLHRTTRVMFFLQSLLALYILL